MTEYLNSMWRTRFFWLSLVRSDLRSRYSGSFLGVGWSLLQPVMMTTVMSIVFTQLFHVDIRTYGPFLMCGLTYWAFITSVVANGCRGFINAEGYIRCNPAPLAIYPLRVVLGAGFHFLLALAVVIAFSVLMRGSLQPSSLLLALVGVAMLLTFGWVVALLSAFANVFFRDTQHLSEIALQVAFYLTPIIYPPEMVTRRGLVLVTQFNPLAVFLDLIRIPILQGEVPQLSKYAIASGILLALGTLAVHMLQRLQRTLIFHL